jgi:hypothetical protein
MPVGGVAMKNFERAFLAVFGFFLFGIGVYVLLFSQAPIPWRVGGGVVLALFDGNTLYASYCGKPSWLSWIGPLP